jgi:hypothetical protein
MSENVVPLYVYSEFTPEGGCMGGDGTAILFVRRREPVCSDSESDSYIECEEKILPSQILLINMISNVNLSCCSGFNRFKLLIVDKNTTNEVKADFLETNEDYLEDRNKYTYMELLKLLGNNEIVKIE